MWEILEHRRVSRKLSRFPVEVLKRYEKWKDIVRISGPKGLRLIKGFHDEGLQELSQNALSKLTGIPQSTISAIENERVNLGVERAKVLARALRCHPAVLVFPGWEVERESAA